MANNSHVSDKMRNLLAARNLDIDGAIKKLGILDWELESKNDLEIAQTVIQKAENIRGYDNEVAAVILKASLKDLTPTDEELAQEFNNRERWR